MSDKQSSFRMRFSGTNSKEESERIRQMEEKIGVHASVPKQRSKVFGKALFITQDATLPPTEPKTEAERHFLVSTLSENFIFTGLNERELNLLVDVMKKEVVSDGTEIIRQGDMGDYFYVVQEGVVNFIVNETMNVGSCSVGGAFGELALLYDAPRAASCIADTERVILWKVDQNTFRLLLANDANNHERKTSEIIGRIPLFKSLDSATKSKFVDALTRVVFKEGDRIMNKGDTGEVFYIIEEGQVRVHDIGYGVNVNDNILGPGEWVGERALLTGEPRVANVTAISENVVTLAMNRTTFDMSIGSLEKVLKYEMKKDCLKVLPRIADSNILPGELDELCHRMTEIRFKKGDKLVEAGKLFARQMFIIRHGKVSVYSEASGVHVLADGDAYGSQFILDDETKQRKNKSKDTVVCDEDTDCYILTRKDIDAVVGDMARLGKHGTYRSKAYETNIKFEELTKHRVLGRGAFGLVWLTSHKDDKENPYALKCMNKFELIEAKMVTMTMREKDILDAIDHPFILPLISSFQDEYNLYLLLKLIQGGELFYVVHNKAKRRKGIPNDDARFYAACVMDALAHFHYRLICYRDLKPENILIDDKGYCIVVDLGFAKIVSGKTYTLCGTPDYLAPEILLSKGHDKAVDWWAFGVLIYEMLVGRAPFVERGKDQMTMFKNIVKGRYSCPDNMDRNAQDLISKLLEKNQSKRLGQLARGSLDIKEHYWFDEIDFSKLLKKEIRSPWIPDIKDPFDASHFHKVDDKEPENPRQLTPAEQKLFASF